MSKNPLDNQKKFERVGTATVHHGDWIVKGSISTLSGAGQLSALVTKSTGTVVANGTTPVTVVDATVTAASNIVFTLKTVGGTVGQPRVATITAGVGFTVVSQASDTSTYNYVNF